MSGLPNIRQVFSLAYRLMTRQFNTESFIKFWLAENYFKPEQWQELQVATLQIRSINKALDSVLKQPNITNALSVDEKLSAPPFVGGIVKLLNGESDYTILPPKKLKILIKAFYGSLNDKLNPLVEALFMIMRGHNIKITDKDEPNKPACAKGAYLGILKAVGELSDIQDIAGISLAGVEIVDCDIEHTDHQP